MKRIIQTITAFLICICPISASTPKINLSSVEFVHRWSQGTQHEFTPDGQEDLGSWEDMVTVNHYPDSGTGESLAGIANNVLGIYHKNGAVILRTDSKPRTTENEAEHLIVVAFPRPEFIEIVFARLAIEKKEAYAIIYSHRIYGSDTGNLASAWLHENGQKTEEALMQLLLDDLVSTVTEIGAKAKVATP
ncbi:hypothetical protein [Coraliomargarita parva]|uniref:hypothetical protein n=1 Tax=Coraliomargarita parva TaxID=3014050 RepID=UPI0022B4CDCE|nr:hypothetical protein [Coraliomargarita parva]